MSPTSSTQCGSEAKRPKKPPTCDQCKARRVLCHPQPGPGAACLRCAEKMTICTTTPVRRGRPPKHPVQASSLPRPHQTSLVLHPKPNFGLTVDCPELSPDLAAHCFEGLKFNPQFQHPLISATSLIADVHAVSFRLDQLPPETRVLALCSVAYASLSAFHRSVLGDGPRPESFMDHTFFSLSPNLLECGVRRAPVYRALRAEALKAAWEIKRASCYLLDLMEQSDFGSAGRPWATAFMSHVRYLAPIYRASSSYTDADANDWAGYLMAQGLISARSRTPLIITPQDQLLLCGSEPPSLETLLDSLEKSAHDPSFSFLWSSMRPCFYLKQSLEVRIINLKPISYARSSPLSEAAVLRFLNSLSMMHSILSLLLDRIDMVAGPRGSAPPDGSEETSVVALMRACGGLVLPLYRELQYRETSDGVPQSERTRERLRTLRVQAHDMAVLGGREFARGIRYLPKIHYSPVLWATVRAWAEFCCDEADADGRTPLSPEDARDIETLADQLKLLGYSLEAASTPHTLALIERLEGHVQRALVSIPHQPVA
ncbi:hypothetical protein B0H19DRAFT_1187152 [Mycena capillaripes]|nr:hypothetical protein B0H19DRAFT_1186846 [Mycena capillaripes]KAJ6533173.1 hypothetical protein B0H19DRAFT_1187152 [Mycena capillaripes]